MESLDAYSYELPREAIAQTPLEDRSASRLLWLRRDGPLEHRAFRDVTTILRAGDLLVVNDSRVSALRLQGRRPSGANVELLLLRQTGEREYEALVRPGRRLRPGAAILCDGGLVAEVLADLADGIKLLRFNEAEDLQALLQRSAVAATPPYVHLPTADLSRYQTVYASEGESFAAPTAGLHFTEELLAQLRGQGVDIARVRLDVGLDTFRPIEAQSLEDHKVRGEVCELPQATADAVASCRGRIVAVGTTTVRTLESFAVEPRRVRAGRQVSNLFIRPGYRFQVIDGMFTNFHMPGTSMLVMLAALAGRKRVLEAYAEALRAGYRFLSFGDSMLIL